MYVGLRTRSHVGTATQKGTRLAQVQLYVQSSFADVLELDLYSKVVPTNVIALLLKKY